MNTIILTGTEFDKKLQYLRLIKKDNLNWEIYYIDDSTGEYWLKEYPQSYAHGGGYPQLRLIEKPSWIED